MAQGFFASIACVLLMLSRWSIAIIRVPYLCDYVKEHGPMGIYHSDPKGIEMLSRSINSETNKLWFLNVNLEILECIRTFADDKLFHFLDEEEEISICYDDILISNGEEVQEKLLDGQLSSATFTYLNNEKKSPETYSEVTINSKDGAEETALTSN